MSDEAIIVAEVQIIWIDEIMKSARLIHFNQRKW